MVMERIIEENLGNFQLPIETRALLGILLLGNQQIEEGKVRLASEVFDEIRRQRTSG